MFSVKERRPLLTGETRERLWPFIGGIARANGFQSIEVGGHVDHAHTHALLSLPPKWSLSKAIQLMKGGSSKFINETFASSREFEWQEGFGGFTIRRSEIDITIAYIRGQEEHHRVRSFEEEYLALLEEHHIEYDARYVFGNTTRGMSSDERFSIVPPGLAELRHIHPRTEVLG